MMKNELFDLPVIGQGDLNLKCDTSPCPNTFT